MAKLLNTLLEERNWKGSELVRRSGVAKSAVYPLLKSSDKLHPKAKMPGIYTVERLMSAFEMNADDAFKAHGKVKDLTDYELKVEKLGRMMVETPDEVEVDRQIIYWTGLRAMHNNKGTI